MTRYCWFFRPLNYDKERLRHRRKGLFFLLPGSGGPSVSASSDRSAKAVDSTDSRGGDIGYQSTIFAWQGRPLRPESVSSQGAARSCTLPGSHQISSAHFTRSACNRSCCRSFTRSKRRKDIGTPRLVHSCRIPRLQSSWLLRVP